MQGFDLVDTLVKINYASGNVVRAIENAEVIYRPRGEFVIITAQQDSPEIHAAVSRMVEKNFPNCKRVVFVSGSQAEVIKKKAAAIKRWKLTDFTDNNRDILAGIRDANTGATLWVKTGKGRKFYQ